MKEGGSVTISLISTRCPLRADTPRRAGRSSLFNTSQAACSDASSAGEEGEGGWIPWGRGAREAKEHGHGPVPKALASGVCLACSRDSAPGVKVLGIRKSPPQEEEAVQGRRLA